MPSPPPHPNSSKGSAIMFRFLCARRRSGARRVIRRPARPLVEHLEDRLAPATFAESGTQLNLDLNTASEAVSIVSNGTSYTLTLNGTNIWSGTNSANVTGNGTATLTV